MCRCGSVAWYVSTCTLGLHFAGSSVKFFFLGGGHSRPSYERLTAVATSMLMDSVCLCLCKCVDICSAWNGN